MALFKHESATDTAPFKERRTKGRVVAFGTDSIADHVPSPAHALQQMLAERTADGFIANPADRRHSLIRFVGLTVLLWGGMATTLATLMILAR